MPITNLQDALSMPETQRGTLTLIDIEHGTKLLLVALPKECQIAPHKAPYPASVQLLTGRIEVMKGEIWIPMVPGEQVLFDANQPHALKAFEASYLLVTHLRS